ncbi:hypothetical protein [Pygmaiobacter massiliensis]|uniref:phage lytic cycle repressor MrpR family protein n=1 Tax=Pygmaiobacter massiliensis TaxID=1917873 RepID=UPI000C7BF36D|nr:hypothetical protein [Pygmaiobacter massiliensis]
MQEDQSISIYNPLMKNGFLKSLGDDDTPGVYKKNIAATLFKVAFYPFEVKWDKDFCKFNYEQTFECLLSAKMTGTASLFYKKITVLREYVYWCAARGEITLADAATHAVMMITRSELNRSANAIYSSYFFSTKEFAQYVSEIGKFGDSFLGLQTLMILAWYGLNYDDMVAMKRTDIDQNNHTACGHVIADPILFEILYRFRDRQYEARECANGVVKQYQLKNDVLLFSTVKGDGTPNIKVNFQVGYMTKKRKDAMQRFPKSSPFSEKNVSMTRLLNSRDFLKVYEFIKDTDDHKVNSFVGRKRAYENCLGKPILDPECVNFCEWMDYKKAHPNI